ncbi:hypothetical protein EON79_01115 [bacterium]|nr:MAG: hypothetical protein EON79_01115 [bacterium]
MTRSITTFTLLAGLLGLAAPKMIGPQEVPIARLLANATENLRLHPKDPEAYYALGRIQYAVYGSTDPRAIRMYSAKPPFRFPRDYPSFSESEGVKPKSDAATLKLVHNTFSNLKKALSMDKGREPGLYALTLACVYEATAPIATKLDRKATRQIFLDEAYRKYRLAFDAAGKVDLDREYAQKPGSYEKWISMEAAEALLRLKPKQNVEEIAAHVKTIEAKPSGYITPIVFSLSADTSLEGLLDRSKRVKFDLDGTGAPQSYPWTRAETAILVWQPDPSVAITSGRQLFGSATWWMMYRDGYAALAALDNDANGWLEGKELNGLAVWRDANQNGLSDPGEVVPVQTVGIQGLATRSTGRTGRSLVSRDGLRMADGRQLSTYDWVVSSDE